MHSFFVSPSSFDVVAVSGQDSLRFLQGQLTCDVEALEENGFCYGAACNNKGRIYAAFILVRWQDSYYLCMAAGLGNVLLSTLKKYLPFYKCSMQLSGKALYALVGDGVQKILDASAVSTEAPSASKGISTADGWFGLLDTIRQRGLLLTERAPEEITTSLHPVEAGAAAEWEALGMLAGHYPFHAEDVERFTPQELHFDRNGYVSFSKGCYTGQEIVARMHYRGKIKKQLYLFTLEGPAAPSNADEPVIIRDAQGEEIGRSLVSRTLGKTTLALVPLPIEMANASVSLFTGDGIATQYTSFQ